MARPPKILIVEDEKVLAENLMIYIQRRGWEARIAPTGRQATDTADAFQPELVLLDYHLPDMDGLQALAAIRATIRSCAGVLMTGHPLDLVMDNAVRHGIRHVLCKPFSLAQMGACLEEALNRLKH